MTAEEIVQIQLDTYNQGDIDGFAACFSNQVQLFNFGEELPFANGIFALKGIYGRVFAQSPELHSKLVNRIVMGNKVIDYEHITGRAGVDFMEIIAIYQVENEKISRVDFIRK